MKPDNTHRFSALKILEMSNEVHSNKCESYYRQPAKWGSALPDTDMRTLLLVYTQVHFPGYNWKRKKNHSFIHSFIYVIACQLFYIQATYGKAFFIKCDSFNSMQKEGTNWNTTLMRIIMVTRAHTGCSDLNKVLLFAHSAIFVLL